MSTTGQFKNGFWQLLISALACAVAISSSLFVGWFLSFIIMRFVGRSLLVGMNYLAWPVVFPLRSLPVTFLLMLVIIPFFKAPCRELFSHRTFLFGILLPTILTGLLLMLATCPLDSGGTFLTRGWSSFG